MRKNRAICGNPYYAFSLIIAAISGAIAVLCLQLYKRQIVRQTLLQMRDFQGTS